MIRKQIPDGGPQPGSQWHRLHIELLKPDGLTLKQMGEMFAWTVEFSVSGLQYLAKEHGALIALDPAGVFRAI